MNDKIKRLECKETVWLTPGYIVEAIRDELSGIDLDPATQPDNPTGARRFYTTEDDGLTMPWGRDVFVNPPYGKDFSKWCDKIGAEAENCFTIAALLPCGSRDSTKYWQRLIRSPYLRAVTYLKRRVKFLDRDGVAQGRNPYDSRILWFNYAPVTDAVLELGTTWSVVVKGIDE